MNKVFKLLFSAALLLCCIMLNAQQPAGDGSQANPYQLTNYADLQWFAAQVNGGQNGICAKLTADITVNAGVLDSNGNLNSGTFTSWTPIGGFNGGGNDYSGEFNGNGHTVSGLYFNDGTKKNVGLFGKTASGAHIHDLGVSDSYFYGKDHVGGICGDFANGRIENCWSEVSIYVTSGDGGGLTGSVFTNAVLKDCHSICNVSGNGSCGLVCGALTGTIENCYAKQINSAGTTNAIGWTSGEGPHTATNVEVKDAAAFASGEVCYKLNRGVTDGTQKWYQTLGTDNFPVLDNSHRTVYYGYDGNVLTYSNSPLTPPSIDNVAYIDANGQAQTADNVSIIMNASEQATWNAGWYVVQGADITLAKGAVCNGEVHLILADGAKLTATGVENHPTHTPGIKVSGGSNSLTIYGQSAQSGQLIANGAEDAAGIGGERGGNGSNITINGGDVTATGRKFAAGIGGGMSSSGSYITINGGNVTANGGQSAAGIGGGDRGSGSYITINGGVVTATGGIGGAGIGAGNQGSCSNINITGGKVTANGETGVAGIGVGNGGLVGVSVSCSNINITGGEVSANGGIGGGMDASVSNIIIAATLLVKADGNNPPVTVIPNTGADLASSLAGKKYVTTEPIIITYGEYITVSPEFESGANVAYGTYTFTAADRSAVVDDSYYEFLGFYKESTFDIPITEGVSGYVYTLTVTETPISVYAKYRQHFNVPYIDANGQEQTVDAVEITSGTLSAGWYVVRGSDERPGPLTCNGEVHIILADGAKLTANGWSGVPGITVSGDGNSLTIYGQTAQSGQLIANGGYNVAGIGGRYEGSGSYITINGGKITANGGYNAAGIGGGSGGNGSNITINGGEVIATGAADGAGIGGGCGGYGSNITINGGEVIATGAADGAGIGGGDRGAGSDITINGGTVTATCGEYGAGIGGGYDGNGSNITINGGTVTATGGGTGGAGIGGGCNGSGYNITINGGTVTANGGEKASCIGRGELWTWNSGSGIFVAAELIVRADNNNPPTTVIADGHTAETDIAGDLDGKRYATISIPQPGVVTYGDYITVNPEIASGARVDIGTEITFTAADRWAENYEFLGFYKESTFVNKITQGVSGLTYTVTATEADISVYAKYKEFILIPYIDADGQEQSTKAAEITNETGTLNAGWYVVTGEVSRGNITCNGAVHLILADGAKLTATGGENQAGITVSGNGKSLTIYGQANQSGQLIANGGEYGAGIGGGKDASGSNITINGAVVTATGGRNAAGIGGGRYGSGSSIIINGGVVTATGGEYGAGIGAGHKGSGSNITINGGIVTANGGNQGAGIGGGYEGSGSNITINGGIVTATGGEQASGIGGGKGGSSSNIKVAAALSVYANYNTNPPITEILHTSDYDIAPNLAGKRYAVVKDDMTGIKEAAIAAINAAIEGVTNEDIIAIATNAIDAINAATSVDVINAIKEQALAAIASAKAILGDMGEPCEDCPAVEVTKGTKTVKLYNPESVKFKKE